MLVRGDEHRLHQVLVNLMSNATRHTPKDTTVTVALADGAQPGTVELSVTDDGPGIPPELQPALFERFVRGDSSRSRAAGSTGLGLAIVDAVTTAHGGSIDGGQQAGPHPLRHHPAPALRLRPGPGGSPASGVRAYGWATRTVAGGLRHDGRPAAWAVTGSRWAGLRRSRNSA